MTDTSGLEIIIETVNNGLSKITAQLNGEPITVELLNLADSSARKKFAETLKAKIPTLELDVIERRLVAEAAKGPGKRIPRPKAMVPWVPFPVNALPDMLRRFVTEGAKAIGCDPSYLALPLLSALAAAIGDTRRLEIKRGWEVPAIIWTAIVGESGTAKSPAFRLVTRPIAQRQGKALERHAEDNREYERKLAHYEKDHASWKKNSRATSDPPVKPEPPTAERFVVADTTVEALAPILSANPRGILLARDELAGWFGSFDRYSSGKGGADESHWLSMFNGESLTVDRKTGFPRTIYVPRALVSVTGSIQPAILRRSLSNQRRESGLAARFLFACPPRTPKCWTEADVDPSLLSGLSCLFDRLFSLEAGANEDGARRPELVALTQVARRNFIDHYDEHNATAATLSGDLAAAWSKLEEYPARLALVVHLARWAEGESIAVDPWVVDEQSMRAGITLANWFKNETRRIYEILDEGDEGRRRRELVEWIKQRGGSTTAREVQQGRRELKGPGEAEAALTDLVACGLGEWREVEPTAKGGRPSREFYLPESSTVYETPETSLENRGFVDVDAPGEAENTPAQPWGEV